MLRQFILIILFGFTIFASAQTDRICIKDGNKMFRKQNYVQAEVLYRKAVSKNPDNAQAVYNLGCALMMQNKDSAAVVQYQKAVKLEKNKLRLAGAYHNIGVICQNHKMYGEAIKAYQQALRYNPKDDETRYNLALCKRLQKEQQKNQKNKDQNQKNNQKDKQNKDKNNKSDNKKDNNKQPEPKEQMSKDNAEQLLNAAIQNEKSTQQRLMKAMQKPSGSHRSQKNW